MEKEAAVVKRYVIWYTHVYANGWENGMYEVQTTSADPSRCARMILTRIGGGSIVGVRILCIDGERVDFLVIPE